MWSSMFYIVFTAWVITMVVLLIAGLVLTYKNPQGSCHYCGRVADTSDFIVPAYLGGTDKVPSCLSCSNAKGKDFPTCQCKVCRASVRRWISKAQRLSRASKLWDHRIKFYTKHIKTQKNLQEAVVESK